MYTPGNFDSNKIDASQIWKEESEINILVLYVFYPKSFILRNKKIRNWNENSYLLFETIYLLVQVELFIHRDKFILEMKDMRQKDFF